MNVADGGGGPWFLGPVVNEDEGAGLGIGCGRTLSLVFPVRAGAGVVRAVMCDACWLPGAVLAVRVGYPGGGPLQVQDVWVCLLQAFEGSEEALLDADMSSSVRLG